MPICNRVEVSLNGKECPVPLRIKDLGNRVNYQQENLSNHYAGSFKWYGPSRFEMLFPVTDFAMFKQIGSSKEEMLKSHNMTVRFLAEDNTPVETVNLVDVRFEFIGNGIDAEGRIYVRITGVCKQLT